MRWNDEIVGLWASPILRSRIDDATLLARLDELAADSTSGDDDTFFSNEDAAVQALRRRIVAAAQAYFRHLKASPRGGFRIRGRFERLARGEARALRHSPDAYLSGIACIRTPRDTGALQLRRDACPGHLSLFDPRPGFNMLSVDNDPYRNHSLTLPAEPGLFALWPASVREYGHPNLSADLQLCVLFDIVPAGTLDAEPDVDAIWQGDIHDAWPTGLIKRRLPAYEQHNDELVALIDALEADNPNLTTDFNTDEFRSRPAPARDWLLAAVNQSIVEYFRQMGISTSMRWDIAIWPNVNRFGDYHSPHNHPWSYLSGTYYVQVPEPDEAGDGGAVRESASISFYDPRPGAIELDSLPPDSPARRTITIKPVAGGLLMWPSSVYHFVHPNLSTRRRYSISFNVHLRHPTN